MKLIISNRLLVFGAPEDLREAIRTRLIFKNPRSSENERLGRWNGSTPEFLFFYKQTNGALILPRAFVRQFICLCRAHSIDFRISDRRRVLPEVELEFMGQLRPFQEEAVQAVLARDFGTLSAPTGSGKTIMGLWLIAQRRQPALVVVHTKELLYQWIERINAFLGVPTHEVGVTSNGKRIIGEKITVGLVQSLYKCASEVAPHIGHVARGAKNGGGICLVLSDRKAHCETLREHLAGQGILAYFWANPDKGREPDAI
jgi:hypothetical protein